jgi:hypothetical protein
MILIILLLGRSFRRESPVPGTPYLAVYRINAPALLETTELPGATLKMGPFSLKQSVPVLNFGAGSASIGMGVQEIPFGPGIYMLVVREHDPAIAESRSLAALAIAEVAALVDMFFPRLIVEKLFEGVVNTQNRFVFSPDGVLTLTARPFEGVEKLRTELQLADALLLALSTESRERFRLASRWFRRGCETINPIDRLLFWYIALEVYPAVGDTDVPRHVRNLIQSRVYVTIDPAIVKDRIGIGRIASLRARVVHEGLSSIPSTESEAFDQRLQQLEALVRTCLRLLVGADPGNDLDRWVVDGTKLPE